MSAPPTLNDVPALLARIADGLDRIAGLIAEPHPGKDSPPSPDAGAATTAVAIADRKPTRRARPAGDKRLAIARLIDREGPQPSAQILSRLGIPETSLGHYIRHPWFAREDGNRKGRVVLTDAGRAALTTAAGQTPPS